ncbi:MAG: hypothetical protein JO080_01055 [Mucilaginibacter sp.]|nr:hypothetical protein [Mucilaginibacter sp.]
MADEINKQITVNVQVNTDGQQQVDQYKASFDELRTTISNLGKPLSELSGSINTLDKDISRFNGTLSKLNSQSKDTATTGNKLKSTFSDLTSTFSTWKGLLKDSLTGLAAWTNEMSAGLTILIEYGPAIIDWVSSLIKGKEAVDQTKMSVQVLNSALEDSDYSHAIEQFNELKINVGLAKQGFLDKKQVLQEYNDTLGKTMGKAANLDEVETRMVKNGDAYVKMTLYKAAAQLALQDAAKKAYEAEQARIKSENESLTFWDKMIDVSNQSGGISAPGAVPNAGFVKNHEQAATLKQDKVIQRRKEAVDDITKQKDAFISIAQKFQNDAAQIAKKSGFDFFSGQISNPKLKAANNEVFNGLSEAEKMRVDSLIRQLQATNQFYSAAVLAEDEHFKQEKDRVKKLLSDKQISRKEYNKVIEQLEAEHKANMANIVQKYRDEDKAKK